MAESLTMPGLPGRVPVLAIRKGEERFASLKGINIEDVEKVYSSLFNLAHKSMSTAAHRTHFYTVYIAALSHTGFAWAICIFT